MKAFGLILIVLGMVVLGHNEFVGRPANSADGRAMPSVLGGITIVAGLICLASGGRRVE
jgi:hypothetical protein